MNNKKYVFGLNFNQADDIMNSETEPLVYTQSAFEAGQLAAYDEGFATGHTEGFVKGEEFALNENRIHIRNFIESINDNLFKIFENEKKYNNDISNTILLIMNNLVKKVFPFYLAQNGPGEIINSIEFILSSMIDFQGITIFVNNSIEKYIEEYMQEIKSKFGEKIILSIDDSLSDWECRLEWKGGGARFDQLDIMNKIDKIFYNKN